MLNALYCHGPRATGISVQPHEMVYWIPTATYAEDPVPCSEQFSASEGLKALAIEHREIRKSVNFLDVLRSIYSKMPGRKALSDPWLQKPATRASPAVIRGYIDRQRLTQQRDSVRPTPAITLLQAFRNDEEVQEKIGEEMRSQDEIVARTKEEITVSKFEARMMQSCPEKLINLRKDALKYEEEIKAFAMEPKARRAIEREWREQQIQCSQRRAKATTRLFEKEKLKPGALDRYKRMVEDDKRRYAKDLKVFVQNLAEFDEKNNILPLQGPLLEASTCGRGRSQ